ncbi:hypothetical protein ANN_17996 [Periplaneta americana]|uniref:Uncharacterized protein n=1 Tax=Periplaneta americana TaxID=6978 RepID=A0ABQ8SNZ6_PERAM|nr:hypothetical protein ANN_17996 [Periplaneta americana]
MYEICIRTFSLLREAARRHQLTEGCFQEDGATCHTSNAHFSSFFEDCVICKDLCPSRSPDFTSTDYFLRRFKGKIYRNRRHTIQDLRTNITAEIEINNIDVDILRSVSDNMIHSSLPRVVHLSIDAATINDSNATVRLKLWLMSWVHAHLAKLFVTANITRSVSCIRERHCDDMPLADQRQIQMERSLTPVSERVRVVEGRKHSHHCEPQCALHHLEQESSSQCTMVQGQFARCSILSLRPAVIKTLHTRASVFYPRTRHSPSVQSSLLADMLSLYALCTTEQSSLHSMNSTHFSEC